MPTPDALDRRDLAAIAGGDRDALGRLYQRHDKALLSFVLGTTGFDHHLAEEVVQDTLFAVWRHAAQFEGRSLVRTWLYTIARRRALSAVQRRRPDPIDPADLVAEPASVAGPEAALLTRITVEALGHLVGRLPAQLQEVLLLAVVEDLPYPEVAEVLDVPVGTVKSRVNRARQRLTELAEASGGLL